MDKKVMYALIGGAAVIGAAVAFHFMGKADSESDSMDADLDQIGALDLDEEGRIKFEQFLKIFQVCSFYGKTNFQEQKKKMVQARREALKSGDEQAYSGIVMQMTQQEEMLIQSKLQQILEKLGISEQEFQQNTMYHG